MCSLTEMEDRKYGRGNKGGGRQRRWETEEMGDGGDKGSVRIFATSMQIK
ncbi:hypothetical protein L0U88_07620 [Flavihumibacter sp. RY-1]|uniref:Uncharacterized protein n=1 Tax=Flavihumibacter fluminis TaxID=2909236 RepID=A0ABS9BFL1_9BACT|nr:hypothetical protein [Flavihumibacter fluminis]MCF1714493.1 hypothetical protein [Flavihumibacter fluminis]